MSHCLLYQDPLIYMDLSSQYIRINPNKSVKMKNLGANYKLDAQSHNVKLSSRNSIEHVNRYSKAQFNLAEISNKCFNDDNKFPMKMSESWGFCFIVTREVVKLWSSKSKYTEGFIKLLFFQQEIFQNTGRNLPHYWLFQNVGIFPLVLDNIFECINNTSNI